MVITSIYVTQRKLKRAEQMPGMLKAIGDGKVLPPIRITEFDDGSFQVEDGHHRLMAHWLSGREELDDGEYVLFYRDEPGRHRYGCVKELYERVKQGLNVEIKYTGSSDCQ